MGFVIKKTIALLAIFLIVPLVIIVANWHWQPESIDNTSEYFFWLTETASYPWAIITSTALFLLFCILIPNKSPKKIVLLWLLLTTTILGGQIIKSIIKSHAAESRPYVLWLTQNYNISDEHFYAIPKIERQEIIHQLLNGSSTIPHWLSRHWQNETGYAFPSGHTLFATTWSFLAIVLLGFRRHYLIVSTLILWAVLMEISRLSLGMHYPDDLILGTFVAWVISLICCFYARKWLIVDS
ncbi:hypothetical protein A9G13_03100 [Gilliamella sp. wkB178]|uniref:phosphatase PAP2 family protein n=1 Tax=Gilliamella sp. wkB178 TaxID=3120259 RepID=UPI00080EDDDD|nr:phosphatase PAP2 family protein [Gilliamella apicola]OCG09057.1 hypothetical protein A9G13_03100 [Gilliamella apicola]